jgi:hypothetical protein
LKRAHLLHAAIVAALAFTALARTASAVEREHHAGVDLGGAALSIADKSSLDVGPGVGGHYKYGLSDEFDLMAEGAWSLVAPGQTGGPKAPGTLPAWVANADVGVDYVFDVLRWVPYAGVLAGGYALAGGTVDHVQLRPGVAAAVGVDYRFNRDFAAGIAVRQHLLFTDATTYPSFTQAFARVEWTWGW